MFKKLFAVLKATANEVEKQYKLEDKVEDVKKFAVKTTNSARTNIASGLINLAELIEIKKPKQIKEIAPGKVEHITEGDQ